VAVGSVVAAPSVLKLIPTSSLAAILVVTGYKLVKVESIRKLRQYGRIPVFIYFATLGGIIASDLLFGVLLGIVLSTIKLIYKVSHLNILTDWDENNQRIDVYLEGGIYSATAAAKTLEKIPPGKEIHIHLELLSYIDHSCLDFCRCGRSNRRRWEARYLYSGIVCWSATADRLSLNPQR
jgi:MFS superfamily sulfate permease-like transporter